MLCPNCKSELSDIEPTSGNGFFIGEVDTETNSVIPTAGFVVDLSGCSKCGFIFMGNQDIIGSATPKL